MMVRSCSFLFVSMYDSVNGISPISWVGGVNVRKMFHLDLPTTPEGVGVLTHLGKHNFWWFPKIHVE